MGKKLDINAAAKHMGVEAATGRGKFRNAGIKPRGENGAYSWDSVKAMEADCAKAMAGSAKKKPDKKSKKAAPAKKSVKNDKKASKVNDSAAA